MAFAQGQAATPSPVTSPISVTSMLSLVTSLIFVIGAILFVGWLYSRMRGVNLGASKVINVLAAQPLGPKEKIVVVQIGSKQIAIGMTPSSLQTLHVFDEPVVQQREGATGASFSERLKSVLGRGAAK
jgi:flagellar protein FliO/FliZ